MFSWMNITTRVLVYTAISSVIVNTIGWLIESDSVDLLNVLNAFYKALSAFTLADIYLEPNTNWSEDNIFIHIGRFLAAATFILGATKAIRQLFILHYNRLNAQKRKNHYFLIGSDIFANSFAKILCKNNKKVTWIGASKQQSNTHLKHLYIIDNPWSLHLAERFGIRKAKEIFITTEDDAEAIAIAQQINELLLNSNNSNLLSRFIKNFSRIFKHDASRKNLPKIITSIYSPWLSVQFDGLYKGDNIRLFSKARIAARRLHLKHPPYLIASAHKQTDLHILIVGCGFYGEAIIHDILMSCLTNQYQRPRFTILDPLSISIRNNFKMRYPELEASADFSFITGSLGENTLYSSDIASSNTDILISEMLIEKISPHPELTAAYVCLPNETFCLSAALTLQSIFHNQNWAAPIFTRLPLMNNLLKSSSHIPHEQAKIISFGSLDEIAHGSELHSKHLDEFGRALHEKYLKIKDIDVHPKSKLPWHELSEDLKDSNRRHISHIVTKLFSIDINIETWLLKNWNDQISIPKNFHLSKSYQNYINDLAKLEHLRWQADRRLNGWRHGEKQDSIKKIHPDLIPYENLSPTSRKINRVLVQSVFEVLYEKRHTSLDKKS